MVIWMLPNPRLAQTPAKGVMWPGYRRPKHWPPSWRRYTQMPAHNAAVPDGPSRWASCALALQPRRSYRSAGILPA